jgi:Ca2+-binding EF-hand superfamily protein
VHRARLTKGKLKALLSRKYKGRVADKILHLFSSDMNTVLDFNQWIELLESLLNFRKDRLMRMVFNVFDFNDDNGVC